MKLTQAHFKWRERGSALLLTLLFTLLGAVLMGLGVDAASLLWVRTHAQTAANLSARAVAMELEKNPAAKPDYLQESARATAAWNGVRHGTDGAEVTLERNEKATRLTLKREAGVYFLRMFRPEPIAVVAHADIAEPGKGGL